VLLASLSRVRGTSGTGALEATARHISDPSYLDRTNWTVGWRSDTMFYFLSTADDGSAQVNHFNYQLWRYSLQTGRRMAVQDGPIIQGFTDIRLIPEQDLLVYTTFTKQGVPQVMCYDLLTNERHLLLETTGSNPPVCIQVSHAYDIFFSNAHELLIYDGHIAKGSIALKEPLQTFTLAPAGNRICFAKNGFLYTLKYSY